MHCFKKQKNSILDYAICLPILLLLKLELKRIEKEMKILSYTMPTIPKCIWTLAKDYLHLFHPFFLSFRIPSQLKEWLNNSIKLTRAFFEAYKLLCPKGTLYFCANGIFLFYMVASFCHLIVLFYCRTRPKAQPGRLIRICKLNMTKWIFIYVFIIALSFAHKNYLT